MKIWCRRIDIIMNGKVETWKLSQSRFTREEASGYLNNNFPDKKELNEKDKRSNRRRGDLIIEQVRRKCSPVIKVWCKRVNQSYCLASGITYLEPDGSKQFFIFREEN